MAMKRGVDTLLTKAIVLLPSLSGNSIGTGGARSLGEGLKHNSALKVLK